MSFNANYYNNFHTNEFTFHNTPPNFVPPPPRPPPFFIKPVQDPTFDDKQFVTAFMGRVNLEFTKPRSKSNLSINKTRECLQEMALAINSLKEKEKILSENLSALSDAEWESAFAQINEYKNKISNIFTQINDTYMNDLRKVLAKRAAKRLRQKRLRLERKREKEDRLKEANERSRKIDEKLQKIKDDINEAKQDEEAKLEADMILKEVLRKKHDAKKCLVKLDGLLKLQSARQKTARGRGENVSEGDVTTFTNNIEKLKSLWTNKLAIYEKEENDLRAKLKHDAEVKNSSPNDLAQEIANNLSKWRTFLFGDDKVAPQVNFDGDIGRFLSVRSQWDQFVNSDGSPLPVGWVVNL